MAKWSGTIGYIQVKEIEKGVWGNGSLIERIHYGDIISNNNQFQQTSDSTNNSIKLTNNISIIANNFAIENFGYMKYAVINGIKWKILEAKVQYPRIILTIGDYTMGSRLELQDLLEAIMGNRNVYYNPPENVDIGYPAIVYKPYKINTLRANNLLYKLRTCYSITIIAPLPNDAIVEKMLVLPMYSFDRHYVSDGLNHDVLQLYY
jgi:hypothetical protein